MPPVSRRLACLAFSAALVVGSGCGSSGGGDDTITASDRAVPFTFDLPTAFRKTRVRPEAGKGDPPLLIYKLNQVNLVDVRKSAASELARDDIQRQVARSLARLGFPGKRGDREQHNRIDMARFETSNDVAGTKTSSRLYFFSGGGATWELECQSSDGQAAKLLKACDTAVGSVEFKGK